MKQITSFLLTLVMLIGMLPGVTLPASAAGGAGDLSKVGNHSDWAANALRWAEGKGILSGVPFTNATEKASRAQTAQMLTNYLRNSYFAFFFLLFSKGKTPQSFTAGFCLSSPM